MSKVTKKVNRNEYLRLMKESVTREINSMLNESLDQALNERLDDKLGAYWQNVKTGVGNVGRTITGQNTKTMVDANHYSQQKDKQRAAKSSNKKLVKVQNTVGKRFQARIAPLLNQHGIDSTKILQAMNTAIQQNMQTVQNVDMNASRRDKETGQVPAGNNAGGNQPSGQGNAQGANTQQNQQGGTNPAVTQGQQNTGGNPPQDANAQGGVQPAAPAAPATTPAPEGQNNQKPPQQ